MSQRNVVPPENILPFEMGYLPESFQEKAREEFNYCDTMRESCLQEIRSLIAKNDSMNGFKFNDEHLLMLLTAKKFHVRKSYAHLNKFLEFRRRNLKMFTVAPYEVMAVFMTSQLATVLPWRCKDGCTLILIQIGKGTLEQHPVEAIKQFTTFMTTACLREPMTQVNGFKVIFDLDITNMQALKVLTPSNIYLFYYGTVVVFPGRFKEIHVVNMGMIGTILWNITRVFLSEKMKKRVHVHSSIVTLLDFFPKSVLPSKYGGDLVDYDMTKWLKKAISPESLAFYTDYYK